MRNKEKLFSIAMVSLITLIGLVSIAGAEPYAYISNDYSKSVSVIDTATNSVIATVGVGDNPAGVAVTPDGKNAYVVNQASNNVSVIDTATNIVIDTINVGITPFEVAVSPDGTKAYVANIGSNTVSVIETTQNDVIDTINVASKPHCLVISPDGEKLYVVNYGVNKVSVINTDTNQVIDTVPVGTCPLGIAITPDGKKVYVADTVSPYTTGFVSIIETDTNAVSTLKVGLTPHDVTISPDGAKAYVSNCDESTISVIDTTTDSITNTISGFDYPKGLCFTPDGTKLFVANFGYFGSAWYTPGTVSVVDPSTNSIIDTIPVDKGPNSFGQFIVPAPTVAKAPTISTISVPVTPIPVGTSITASASVTYLGSLSDLTAEWNWGDGSTITSGSQVSSNFETSHVYNSPGVYTITFTVKDNNGGTDTQQASDYVVVYDPNGGFVTGGGWINSPAGAYLPDDTLAGKATFGFVSKYQKGATVPTGNTEFQFKVADLNFKSTSYEWLVAAGPQAKYKGTGTINGKGNYGFMLSAVDGAIKGDGIDKFRIKIWDKDNGDITVYDNEIDSGVEIEEDVEPSTVISGGSIVIHKEK